MELSNRIKSVKSSLTLDITSLAKRLKASGRDVVGFGAGELDFDTPLHIKDAAISAIKQGFTKYTPACGTDELKSAICEKFRIDNNLNYNPGQIAVSCGAKHSIYNIIQVLCQEGDEVIIPSPYWLSYPDMAALAAAESIFVKASPANFKVSPCDISKAISRRSRLLILNSPSNPSGCVYNKRELLKIAEIAVSKNIIVISDEIYEKLNFTQEKHVSIASLGKDIYNQTVVVNGVSKTYSMTGWRIGYAAGPQEIIEALCRLQSHSTSNPASISQKAAFAALTGDQKVVDDFVCELKKRRDYLVKRLNAIAGLSCVLPEGAFYAFCDISKTRMNSAEFSRRLLEEADVAVVPGVAFGWDTHVRISFATSMDNIKKGVDRIENWLNKRK